MDLSAAQWFKSSYSGAETNCVEVAWHKSSYSGVEGDCVEVSYRTPHVALRDSQHPSHGYFLFPGVEWAAFVRSALRDEL